MAQLPGHQSDLPCRDAVAALRAETVGAAATGAIRIPERFLPCCNWATARTFDRWRWRSSERKSFVHSSGFIFFDESSLFWFENFLYFDICRRYLYEGLGEYRRIVNRDRKKAGE